MAATEITCEAVRALLPERPAAGHKGTFGHLYAICGSRGFTGAAKMVGLGAARSGVGLVTLGVPESLGDVVAAGLTEVMTMLLPGTSEESISAHAVEVALNFARDKDAIAIGPGLSQHLDTRAFVQEFVSNTPAPTVIDADALNAVSNDLGVLSAAQNACVLTPHPGEMARLCASSVPDVQQDREGCASAFAKAHGCVVVLKGHCTVVAGPGGDLFVNPTGNAGLGSGGTGDVLTGVIGALLAQEMSALDAAVAGVYAQGLAGDLAARAKGERGMIASDVIDELPNAWRAIESGDAS